MVSKPEGTSGPQNCFSETHNQNYQRTEWVLLEDVQCADRPPSGPRRHELLRLAHGLGLRLRTHARAPAVDEVPRCIHQVIVPVYDLARTLIIAVVLAKLAEPVRQAGRDLELA